MTPVVSFLGQFQPNDGHHHGGCTTTTTTTSAIFSAFGQQGALTRGMSHPRWAGPRFRLASVASVPTYESLPVDLFQHKLNEAWTDDLEACRESSEDADLKEDGNDGWIRYQPESLHDCLLGVDWQSLCRDCDERWPSAAEGSDGGLPPPLLDFPGGGRTLDRGEEGPSPLRALVTLLVDPTVCPHACVTSLIRILLSVIIFGGAQEGTSKMTVGVVPRTSHGSLHSQRLLLQCLDRVVSHAVSGGGDKIFLLSNTIVHLLRQLRRTHSPCQNASDSSYETPFVLVYLRRILSLVKRFTKAPHNMCDPTDGIQYSPRFRANRVAWTRVLVELLSQMDDSVDGKVSASSVEQQQRSRNNKDNSVLRQRKANPAYLPSRQYTLSASVAHDLLHGELSDDDLEGLRPLRRHSRSSRRLDSEPFGSAENERHDADGTRQRQWRHVRGKCLQTLLSLGASDQSSAADLLLLQSVELHPWSPCLRLAIVHVLTTPKSPSHKKVRLLERWLNRLWNRILELYGGDGFNDERFVGLLHFYGELLAECDWFRSSRLLVPALYPLLRLVLSSNSGSNDASSSVGAPQTDRHLVPFRCCLVYVGSRRGMSAIEQAVLSLSTCTGSSQVESSMVLWQHLTLAMDNWNDWYHSAWHTSRVEIQLALQTCGILSVCEDDDDVAISQSPPRIYRGMREVAMQLECCNDLIRCCFSESLSPEPTHAPAPKGDHRPPGYLSNDIIQHMFAYLGYKRLVRARSVCREWKDLADRPELWYRIYRLRYGFHPDDPAGRKPVQDGDWKHAFVEAWTAERSIRLRRNWSSGWKARLCRYVGCLQVCTSQKQAQRHEASHRRPASRIRKLAGTNPDPTIQINKRQKTKGARLKTAERID